MTKNTVRQDIQGLRALAVMSVVVYHLWPEMLSGGFAGVDVFFVISGFLITRHLLDDIQAYGRIRFITFWTKRVRRLLPASVFVLMVVLVVILLFFPAEEKNLNLREIFASALYVQNWMLIHDSTDYLKVHHQLSLVRHYWSLSVEEQFYFFWPLFIGVVGFISNTFLYKRYCGNTSKQNITLIAVGIALIFFFSLTYSSSFRNDQQTYFSTFSRAWEFASGGLVAFWSLDISRSHNRYAGTRLIGSWSGVVLILISCFSYSSETAFPGFAALLPVLGTVLVIVSASDGLNYSFGSVSQLSAVKFLGDTSYSIYLWHWPLVVGLPLLLPVEINGFIRGSAVLFITLVLSWFSRRWIELPLIEKKSRRNAFKHAPVFLMSSISIVLCASVLTSLQEKKSHSEPAIAKPFSDVDELRELLARTIASDQWPSINQLPGQHAHAPEWIEDGCLDIAMNNPEKIEKCTYGTKNANKVIALVGDSTLTQFLPAIRQGLGDNWSLVVLTRGQCPVSRVDIHKWGTNSNFRRCNKHRELVFDWVETNRPAVIIVSESVISTAARLQSKARGNAAMREIWRGYLNSYTRFSNSGSQVIHIESPPRTNCNFKKNKKPSGCHATGQTLFERKVSEGKLSIARSLGFEVIDTTFWFCTRQLICPNQIGDHLVKADPDHLSANFSRQLADLFSQKVMQYTD